MTNSSINGTTVMDERSGFLLPATQPQESNPILHNLRTPSQRFPEETAKIHALKKQEETKGRDRIYNGEVITCGAPLGQQWDQLPRTSWTTIPRPPALGDCSPDKTKEAKSTFQVISSCVYTSENIGSSQDGSMVCKCTMKLDGHPNVNTACGEDDCINRATKMECVDKCGCGDDCQNRRFQRQEFADVAVFETNKKGYGLRAKTDLSPDRFIHEYVGEVIDGDDLKDRMLRYSEEGIKDFYFMSLGKGEFVDATKKGNLGIFFNHSCNPNCYVEKWVVGNKVRIGIFAKRTIDAGEELGFNYNIDQYGANPQPCYCGGSNCTGFIQVKTRTERAAKLRQTIITPITNEQNTPPKEKADSSMLKVARGEDVPETQKHPFVCTFSVYGCKAIDGSKNEWKRHINVQHMQSETWICDIGTCAPQNYVFENGIAHTKRKRGVGRISEFLEPSNPIPEQEPKSDADMEWFPRKVRTRRKKAHEKTKEPAKTALRETKTDLVYGWAPVNKQNTRRGSSTSASTSVNHKFPEPSCHKFDRKDLFTTHLKHSHAPPSSACDAEKSIFNDVVETALARCHVRLRELPTDTICPFCPHHPAFELWDDRLQHVGNHLKNQDFDLTDEIEDVALRNWMMGQGFLKWEDQGWRLTQDERMGKTRKRKGHDPLRRLFEENHRHTQEDVAALVVQDFPYRPRSHLPADIAIFSPPNIPFTPESAQDSMPKTEATGRLYLNPCLSSIHQGPSGPNMVRRQLKFRVYQEPPYAQDERIQLPNLQGYLSTGTDVDVANALVASYRIHCMSVIHCFRFLKEKSFWHHFTSFHGKLTVPIQKLLAHPDIAAWITECDWLMYQMMIRLVSPLALQVIPPKVIDTFQSISVKLSDHISNTFQNHPRHVRDAKLGPAAIFAGLIDRLLRVNVSARAAANKLTDDANRDQMWHDWICYVKPISVVESTLPAGGHTRTLQILTNEVRELLGPLKATSYPGMQPIYANAGYNAGSNLANAELDNSSTSGVLDRWVSFAHDLPSRFPTVDARVLLHSVGEVSSAALRDITMAQALSLGSWLVTKVWIDEILHWLAEKGGFLESSRSSIEIMPYKGSAVEAGFNKA